MITSSHTPRNVARTRQRKVLILSPHFPPINAPDMHRIRLSLPYFADFGWKPIVLAVHSRCVEGVREPLLLETFPEDVTVRRVAAVPVRWTRKLGIGALGLRSFPFLYREGIRMIRQEAPDLVYISTTMFHTMALGRLWQNRFRVPYVLDMQDPWVNDDWAHGSGRSFPWKHRLARRGHCALEPWTMRNVDGLIAVSRGYVDTLHKRYPWTAQRPSLTLPFGSSEADFQLVHAKPQPNRFLRPGDGFVHGVYVGCAGPIMERALRVIFEGFRMGLRECPSLFSRVRLHFVGTSYAPGDLARQSVRPVAEQLGVAEFVREHEHRIPYFEALQLLSDADFLLVPGSDNPQYTASKICPYIMARKPLLGVFHERSSVIRIVEKTEAGSVVPFGQTAGTQACARRVYSLWKAMLEAIPFEPGTNWAEFERYTAREMTRQQCGLFDRVVAMPQRERGKEHAA